MGTGMIRIDRGDGKVFQYQPEDAQKFLKANPGARIVPGRGVSVVPTPAEVAATVAIEEVKAAPAGPKRRVLSDLTLPELLELAERHGIPVAEGAKKADVFKALKDAKVKPDEEEPPADNRPDLEFTGKVIEGHLDEVWLRTLTSEQLRSIAESFDLHVDEDTTDEDLVTAIAAETVQAPADGGEE